MWGEYLRSTICKAVLPALVLSSALYAQSSTAAKTLVTESINGSNIVRLAGNMRPEATPANDKGPLADSHVLQHMFMLLNRPADRETAIETYADSLSDPTSPNYHRWLTAKQVEINSAPIRPMWPQSRTGWNHKASP